MKTQTIKALIADVIEKEGGYVNHPNDRGGPTNYGITKWSYAEFFHCLAASVTEEQIKALTQADAEKIYYVLYYVKPGIQLLPEPIQPIMLDMAVNHGRRGAVKILQQTLLDAKYSHSKPDGLIGEKTLTQTRTAIQELGQSFITNLVNQRIDYYNAIIENDPSQAVFKNGWIARAETFRPELA